MWDITHPKHRHPTHGGALTPQQETAGEASNRGCSVAAKCVRTGARSARKGFVVQQASGASALRVFTGDCVSCVHADPTSAAMAELVHEADVLTKELVTGPFGQAGLERRKVLCDRYVHHFLMAQAMVCFSMQASHTAHCTFLFKYRVFCVWQHGQSWVFCVGVQC